MEFFPADVYGEGNCPSILCGKNDINIDDLFY